MEQLERLEEKINILHDKNLKILEVLEKVQEILKIETFSECMKRKETVHYENVKEVKT